MWPHRFRCRLEICFNKIALSFHPALPTQILLLTNYTLTHLMETRNNVCQQDYRKKKNIDVHYIFGVDPDKGIDPEMFSHFFNLVFLHFPFFSGNNGWLVSLSKHKWGLLGLGRGMHCAGCHSTSVACCTAYL